MLWLWGKVKNLTEKGDYGLIEPLMEISTLQSLSQRSWKLNGEGTLFISTISLLPEQVETVNMKRTMVGFILYKLFSRFEKIYISSKLLFMKVYQSFIRGHFRFQFKVNYAFECFFLRKWPYCMLEKGHWFNSAT